MFGFFDQVFTPNGFYTYRSPAVWTGGASGASLVTGQSPAFPNEPGRHNETYMRLSPAFDTQPFQQVVNGLPRFNQEQLASMPLAQNGSPAFKGVLPYF